MSETICKLCGKPFPGDGLFPNAPDRLVPVLCIPCSVESRAIREELRQKQAAEERRALAARMWLKFVPPAYQKATLELMPDSIRTPLSTWDPNIQPRLGICGPPGCGKTMAVAHLIKDMEVPFKWIRGSDARPLYAATVSGEWDSRQSALSAWRGLIGCDLLVLDDIDKGAFTESWAFGLYSLIEDRNSMGRVTIWTSNHGPGHLAQKFAKCGDVDLADSLERRMCSDALIVFAQP